MQILLMFVRLHLICSLYMSKSGILEHVFLRIGQFLKKLESPMKTKVQNALLLSGVY